MYMKMTEENDSSEKDGSQHQVVVEYVEELELLEPWRDYNLETCLPVYAKAELTYPTIQHSMPRYAAELLTYIQQKTRTMIATLFTIAPTW